MMKADQHCSTQPRPATNTGVQKNWPDLVIRAAQLHKSGTNLSKMKRKPIKLIKYKTKHFIQGNSCFNIRRHPQCQHTHHRTALPTHLELPPVFQTIQNWMRFQKFQIQKPWVPQTVLKLGALAGDPGSCMWTKCLVNIVKIGNSREKRFNCVLVRQEVVIHKTA